jgi:acyl transferase domain-containing protein/acyl carrier protein
MSAELGTEKLTPVKSALLALNEMRAKLEAAERQRTEPIAIVGIGCRFPGGANDPESFWQLLAEGRDAVTEVPAERWPMETFYDPNQEVPGKMVTRWGAFLEKLDHFDPLFFGISPREAVHMDPQQRLLLEVAWEALQDAGQTRGQLAGSRTGVFVGLMGNDYSWLQYADPLGVNAYTSAGSLYSFVPNRLSYWLDLRGPSVAVDTACSSSLVAIHLACQSLRNREADLALAGGVNALISPLPTVAYSKWGMMSPDGRCKTFDARANGFVRGEGCGLIVLKRLSDALAQGDSIWAVIRGSAVNQDGLTSVLTAPNGLAQQAVIRQALQNAGVAPQCIGYVEAHGTGTALGDPIEVEALSTVVGQPRDADSPCFIGSVKTNIGHLEGAAGIAGLIKTVLCLRHGAIPPNLHFQTLNPHIRLDSTTLAIPTQLHPWPSTTEPRCAGVSSFGAGGTNAHLVLEEAPVLPRPLEAEQPVTEQIWMLPISAHTPEALRALAESYRGFLVSKERGEVVLPDVVYTASVRRDHLEHRLAVVGASSAELAERFDAFLSDQSVNGLAVGQFHSGQRNKVIFIFPGQGGQWLGMACQLLKEEPIFRAALEKCGRALQRFVAWSLLEELMAEASRSRLGEIDVVQPILFSIQVALSALWRSWGIEPDTVIGHSMGEVAAACVAGALRLEDAAQIICRRSRLLKQVSGKGAMAVVELPLEAARQALAGYEDRLSIAVSNGPRSTVLSGDPAALQAVMQSLQQQDIFCRAVQVDVAAHSPQMDPLCTELLNVLDGIQPQAARVRMISTVTGQAIEGVSLDANYWARNLREPVLFSQTLQQLTESEHHLFIEISPHPTLLHAVEQSLQLHSQAGITLPSMRRGDRETAVLRESLAQLYVGGASINWKAIFPTSGRGVKLPAYPWQRERFWVDEAQRRTRAVPGSVRHGMPSEASHPWLGKRLPSPLKEIQFETVLSIETLPWLVDHQVYSAVVVPGAYYLTLALQAAEEIWGTGQVMIEVVTFIQPLLIETNQSPTLHLVLSPEDGGSTSFRLFSLKEKSLAETAWTLHVSGKLKLGIVSGASPVSPSSTFETLRAACQASRSGPEFYRDLFQAGYELGPAFQRIEELHWKDEQAICRIKETENDAARTNSASQPTLIDACFQLLCACLPEGGLRRIAEGREAYVPFSVAEVRVHQETSGALWAYAVRQECDLTAGTLVGDVQLIDSAGRLQMEIRGLCLKRTSRGMWQTAPVWAEGIYQVEWRPEALNPRGRGWPSESGRWLILADRGGIAANLARQLEAQGETCLLVEAANQTQVMTTGEWNVTSNSLEDIQTVVGQAPWRGVVHLWSLNVAGPDGNDETDWRATGARSCGSLLQVVQALIGCNPPPRLWVVTRQGQAVTESDQVLPEQTGVWGLARVIALEHPELRCGRVDLGERGGERELFEAIWADEPEDEVAFRNARRYLPRLVRQAVRTVPEEFQPLQLALPRRGALDYLTFHPCPPSEPGPGEVKIRVYATGLNFRDVLNALGAYPGEAGALGLECAGEIAACGEGVMGFSIGQPVMGVAFGSFATFVTTPEKFVVPIPPGLTFEQAATLPIAFLTANYGLNDLAKLAAGERVLIHAAAGGVGLAAVQLAQRIGAEVFATAGSPAKREFLRQLGVRYVFDSRTLNFADEIRQVIGNQGLHVILNSLTGEFIPQSLSLLAPNGRFVEMGKRNIWGADQVAALRNDVAYTFFDMAEVMRASPDETQAKLVEIATEVAKGHLRPLPQEAFPFARVSDAFRHMAQAKHIGKVVVTQPQAQSPETSTGIHVRREGSYLITGGLSGLGLRVAQWLVERGAGELVLLGRRGPSPATEAILATLEQTGARVRVVTGDVAEWEWVEKIIAEIGPRLCGIVHSAGVLDDGLLKHQSWERFERVWAPKVAGAWNLHRATQHLNVDFFVLFSSATSLLGTPGQGNYAAANAFLDGLAHHRRCQGLPGLSVNWGPWSEVGLAARAGQGERLARQGLRSWTPAEGTTALAYVLGMGQAAQVALMGFEAARWLQTHPAAKQGTLLAEWREESKDEAPASVREQLQAAEPRQRRAILTDYLRRQIAHVLRLSPARVADHTVLKDLGLDSLTALEIRNRLEASLGLSLSATLVWNYPNLTELVPHLAEKLNMPLASADRGPGAEKAMADSPVVIETTLSEAELNAQLSEELAQLNQLLQKES